MMHMGFGKRVFLAIYPLNYVEFEQHFSGSLRVFNLGVWMGFLILLGSFLEARMTGVEAR
jgi:hypothetical protein